MDAAKLSAGWRCTCAARTSRRRSRCERSPKSPSSTKKRSRTRHHLRRYLMSTHERQPRVIEACTDEHLLELFSEHEGQDGIDAPVALKDRQRLAMSQARLPVIDAHDGAREQHQPGE